MHTAIECFGTRVLSKCVVTAKNLLSTCKHEAVNAYNRHLILLRQKHGLCDAQHGATHWSSTQSENVQSSTLARM